MKTLEQKILDKIQQIRKSLPTEEVHNIKFLATKLSALEGFLNNFRAYGLSAVSKTSQDDLEHLLGIDDELSLAVEERIGTYATLLQNMKTAIEHEISNIFLSCQTIDFTDKKQISVLDLRQEELRSLRYYLKQMEYRSWSVWCNDISRMDKSLIRRCLAYLPSEQQSIVERLL